MSYELLTTKPATRLFSIHHPEWLYIRPTEAKASAYLRGLIRFTDGTSAHHDLKSLGNLRQHECQWVNISYNKRGYQFLDSTKVVKSIQLYINTSGTDTIEESITLIPVTYNVESAVALYYYNSRAGLDSFICTGDMVQSSEFFSILSEKAIEADTGDNPTAEAEAAIIPINQYRKAGQQVFSGNKPKEEIKALDDFFLIRRGFELMDIDGIDTLVPIIPQEIGISLPEDRASLHQSTFSYQYAQNQYAIDQIKHEPVRHS